MLDPIRIWTANLLAFILNDPTWEYTICRYSEDKWYWAKKCEIDSSNIEAMLFFFRLRRTVFSTAAYTILTKQERKLFELLAKDIFYPSWSKQSHSIDPNNRWIDLGE